MLWFDGFKIAIFAKILKMIVFEDALRLVTTDIPTTKVERIPFREAVGRVLAEDVFSDMNMPPFDKAAVDGFACRIKDLDKLLSCVEVIPAGSVPSKRIEEGTCAKIMTGSMIPEGADTVVMVEKIGRAHV